MAAPKLSRSVRGLTVFITGAASGMGEATAELFAAEGANVAACDLNAEGLQTVVGRIEASGGRARGWTLDVSDRAGVERVVAEAAEAFGGLDLIVNNAGVASRTPIDAETYEAVWDRLHGILLAAHMRVIRAALPHLRKSASPRIVNIASTEALGATAGNSIYAAFKSGVTGLTRALAVELGPEGITVNAICPGPILTGMTGRFPEADRELYARRRTALRRYGDPEEVAHITLSLCLPAASFITGVAIPVDGGLMARNA
jgi:3-oxoacyl-[acyl-carrier protein] reductase